MKTMLISVLIFLVPFNIYAIKDELAFEAEDFDKIEHPMVVVKDDKVSGGAYIKSPTGRAGWAEYEIEIPDDLKYYMWGMVQEHDGVTDSFFITFNLLDRGADDDINPNTWDMNGPANAWGWDKVRGRGVGGDPRVFTLDKGKHKLRVWTRENEAWLDCIYMSTEMNAVPILASEFKGRKRTIAPKAVNSIGKSTITWGKVKYSY